MKTCSHSPALKQTEAGGCFLTESSPRNRRRHCPLPLQTRPWLQTLQNVTWNWSEMRK